MRAPQRLLAYDVIHVDRDGRHIILKGWVGPDTPAKCKDVGAGRYASKPFKHWSFPLTTTTCRRLRKVFGSQLRISPELNAWAKEAFAEEARLEALKTSPGYVALPGVARLAPEIDTKARPYQRAAIAFGAALGTFGIFDQPGLGKTLETIGAIIERAHAEDEKLGLFLKATQKHAHLILAPKIAVEAVWPQQVGEWCAKTIGGHPFPSATAYALTGTREEREATLARAAADNNRHVFVATTIESVRLDQDDNPLFPALHAMKWDTVVVDESHRALIRSKVKATGASKTKLTATRRGMSALKSDYRIALSGTPMRGKPHQLWGTLNWLRPDLYTSYWHFVGQFFELQSNGFSDYVLGDLKPGAEEELARAIAPLVLRRTKEECMPELPPKMYAGTHLIPGDPDSPFGVWLTPSAKHLKQYEAFQVDGVLEDENGEVIANGSLAEYTRRAQLSSAVHTVKGGTLAPTLDSCKFDWLVEKCAELGLPDEGRLVVAAWETKLLNAFAAGLEAKGIPCHVLTGETNSKERVRIVADFQSDAPTARVFLLNTKAGGVAVTLDAADELVLLDETTVPDDQEQVEDRVHRASRMHQVTIHYLRTLGTQDEEVAWVAAARESIQKWVLDGARGISQARALYQHTKES